jgi:hypothetical protein
MVLFGRFVRGSWLRSRKLASFAENGKYRLSINPMLIKTAFDKFTILYHIVVLNGIKAMYFLTTTWNSDVIDHALRCGPAKTLRRRLPRRHIDADGPILHGDARFCGARYRGRTLVCEKTFHAERRRFGRF